LFRALWIIVCPFSFEHCIFCPCLTTYDYLFGFLNYSCVLIFLGHILSTLICGLGHVTRFWLCVQYLLIVSVDFFFTMGLSFRNWPFITSWYTLNLSLNVIKHKLYDICFEFTIINFEPCKEQHSFIIH